MNATFRTPVRIAPVFIVMLLATSATAQTLFTTKDYRQDRPKWTDPAYFNHNTARDFLDMHAKGYGTKGSAKDDFDIYG
jgi:hypothetical protein